MRSLAASTLSPSVASLPLTVTSPWSISSSQWRRLPRPACARTFCSRSLGIERVRTEPLLECLHHLRAGNELAQRRKVIERVEPEPLEEQARGAVQECEARTGIAGDLLDETALLQRAHHPVDVDT